MQDLNDFFVSAGKLTTISLSLKTQEIVSTRMSNKKKAKTEMLVALVNGLPGSMGKEIAKVCVKRGIKVAEFALTGPNMPEDMEVDGVGKVQLIDASKAEEAKDALSKGLEKLEDEGYIPIAIDFTHPSSVNPNADLYNELELPFVMGTTGGDRELLVSSTTQAKNHAVIAPNMCKQIVAFQTMFDYMEKQFPNCFDGFEVTITESHQKTKADTSGTAKALTKSFGVLTGQDVQEDSIKRLRTDEDSKNFGVPEEHLAGHAHHTYHLENSDKSVVFEFKHNINGRSTYAEGVVDAVEFLGSRVANRRNKPKIYNMIDILKAGAMN